MLDRGSRVLYINHTLAAWSHHTPEQLIGRPLAEVWPHLRQDLPALIERCREHPSASAQLDRAIELDAHAPVRRALFSCHVTLQQDGSAIVGLVVLDIATRVQTEAALQESEERYRALVNSSPDSIMVLKEGRILFANPAAAAMAGVADPAQLVGMDAFDWVTPRSRGTVEDMLAALRTQKVVPGGVVEFVIPNGTVRWAESHAAMVSFHGDAVIQIISRDITERLGTEMALRAGEERYRSLIESSPNGIVVCEDETIVYANAIYAQMIEFEDAAQLIGRSIFEVAPDHVRPLVRKAIERVLLDGKPYREELCTFKNGEQSWYESTTTLMEIAGHAVVQATIRDISDHKRAVHATASLNERLEERVADRTRQLAAALQELEAFSYSVSHDLRAPLRHISGHASRLIELPDVAANEEAGRHARGIVSAAARLGQLVDDLLDFSRMGRTQMREMPVDMNEIVNSARRDLEADTADRKIVWRVECLPACHGDPAMLKLVWHNLIGNAMKYTRTRAEAHIALGATTTATEVTYHVRDNGVGFDMRYADKLFGVFERLHGQREFEGTGIGLATVRRVVQRLGGRVWAEAQVDAGATFYFSLPAAQPC